MSSVQDCIADLESMRRFLHRHFGTNVPKLEQDLLAYADELDKAYKGVKIAKIAGSSTGIVGGVVAATGFGLSFVTFGASLVLLIVGGVIGGAGGLTSGGASAYDFAKAREARNKTKELLEVHQGEIVKMCKKMQHISDKLKRFGNIEEAFPSWWKFWRKLLLGSGQIGFGVGWQIVYNTVTNVIRIGKVADLTGDVFSAAVPLVRTLGNTARGFHIAGGAFGAAFVFVDLYSLVSNSRELCKNKAHDDSERIREIVNTVVKKCPKPNKIDEMIDDCLAALP